MQFRIGFSLIALCSLVVVGCSKNDDPVPEENDGELITTLRLKFVNMNNASDTRTATWKDADGQGGNPPVIDTIRLAPGAGYTMTVDAVLNESGTSSNDITPEIIAEADHHLFVFKQTGVELAINATDKDSKGLPIGLVNDVRTGTAVTGSLRVILRHQVNSKDGSEGPGSSDIDTSFPVVIR